MADAPFLVTSPSPASERGAFRFALGHTCSDTGARTGVVRTPHGSFATPAFMPVGTAGSVKGVDPDAVKATGSEILLGNTYHLLLRPGPDVIRELGGLHRFMGWDGPILTDSGGYQVFSLGESTQRDRDGVTFRSHLDGRPIRLTPEIAMATQAALGADIAMVFDECLPADSPRALIEDSLRERTLPWERRSLACHPGGGRAVFAIGQGGLDESLRKWCLEQLMELPFDGFAIGGLSVGESPADLRRLCRISCDLLPKDRPRYLMGVGSVPELLDAVALGVDMFDCVLPTRNARNACALTFDGPLRLRNASYARDGAALEADCPCSTCRRGFSRAFLRHLHLAREILAPVLTSVHNLCFQQRLMSGMRDAIRQGTFEEHRRAVAHRFVGGPDSASEVVPTV